MPRRLHALVALAAALAPPAGCAAGDPALPAPKTAPFAVVVVVTDDQGYGDLGSYLDDYPGAVRPEGVPSGVDPGRLAEAVRAAMPTVDRLAAEGVRLTNALAASAECSPSRAAFLTGRYPQRWGVYTNDDGAEVGVPASETPLPELFQRAGYATALVGKWHLSPFKARRQLRPPDPHPLDKGFDFFFGFNHSGSPYRDSGRLWRDRERAEARGFLTDQLTDEAIGFLARSAGEPLFLYLAYNAPHGPLGQPAPEAYRRPFATGDPGADNYLAYLRSVDAGVERLLEHLRAAGRERDTLFLFTSDNGGRGDAPATANGPFRGFKGQIRQGGLRVPLIARWPGGLPSGRVSAALASGMDLLPTALAAAGIEIPAGLELDGRDLLPALRGETDEVRERLFWAGRDSAAWASPRIDDRERAPAAWAVLGGGWMLRCCGPDRSPELFDVRRDPGESRDVAREHPERVERLLAAYREWVRGLAPAAVWRPPNPRTLRGEPPGADDPSG
ncbi:MAG: sulfatase-like hydrolase/transferase [Thermoanaerobaculia bacterium]|nr:sulfatase-like hydrolase/transferase [Thermoanaerobaculia bacterium]